jgi:hypothetical protein
MEYNWSIIREVADPLRSINLTSDNYIGGDQDYDLISPNAELGNRLGVKFATLKSY